MENIEEWIESGLYIKEPLQNDCGFGFGSETGRCLSFGYGDGAGSGAGIGCSNGYGVGYGAGFGGGNRFVTEYGIDRDVLSLHLSEINHSLSYNKINGVFSYFFNIPIFI